MYCTRCGTRFDNGADRYCVFCGAPTAGRAAVVEPGAVWKGELVARLSPPFEPFGKYRAYGWAATGAFLALLGVSLRLDWAQLTVSLLACLFWGGIFLLNRVVFLLRSVRVYENGLEQDIPRSWNKSVYLPWHSLTEYHWEGDILHYSWPVNGVMILRDGRWPSSWPMFYFVILPKALRAPAGQNRRIQDLLVRAGRQACPKPGPANVSSS